MIPTRPWQPLRLEDPYLPELPEEGSITVALVASPATRAAGWSARAAGAMARGWALSGQPTYLCDLALDAPELHTVLGVDNDEGVTDLLLYGASPRRVAHPIDEALFLAPAGTVAPDPAAVLSSPRWDALVDAFAGAGALLLLYVPADAPGVAAVLARADALVLLCGSDEVVDLGEAQERLVGRLGPDPSAPPPPEAVPATPPAKTAPPPGAAPVSEVPPAADPTERGTRVGRGQPEPARGWGRWLLVVLVIAVLAALLVAMGWIEIPGVAAAEPGARAEATLRAEALAPDEPLQGWSLALEAYPALDVARTRVDELRGRWPELLFWIAPVEVDERVFHRVLAGPATSPDEVEDLRARLGGDERWIPRRASLGFLLGEMPDLDSARTWSDALSGLLVPTHVLRVGDQGRVAYRVYAGSYADEAEAEALRRMLEDQGLGSAALTERRGVHPA
jgi:cell division septation protein DedD